MCDEFDIKNLPEDLTGRSKPSQVIERLLEKRQKQHKEVLSSLELQKDEINIKINEQVENEGQKLTKKLIEYKKEGDETLYLFKNKSKFALEKNEWSNVLEKIQKIHNARKTTIEEYNDFLTNLENERSSLYKNVLKQSYQKICKICFKLPYEIGEFFEFEILKINQVALSNFHVYFELKNDLLSQVEETMRQWTFRLQEIKETCLYFAKVRAQQCVDELQKKQLKDLVREDNYLSDESEKLNSEVLKLKSETSNVPINLEEAGEWLKNVQITLACMDLSAKNFVGFYKQATVTIFNRFFDELESISRNLEDSGIVHRGSVDTVQYEIYTLTIGEMGLKFESELELIKNLWGEIINSMAKTVSDTYRFLRNVVTLWDFHFKRIEGLQYLILKDLKKTIDANDTFAKSTEIKMNVLIDTLRQESSIEKSNKCMEDIKKALNDIENVYIQQFNTESLVLRKYKQYVDIAIDVLMSEIKRFALFHPPDFDKDPKKQRKRASQTSEIINPNDELIPMQMVYCRFQVDAVSNWMFGLYEAINNYIENGKNELLQAAEDWIKKETEKLDNRLKIRIAFHKSRNVRVETNIYKVRTKELCIHTNRITEHKIAIEKKISDIKMSINDSEIACQTSIDEYDKRISEIKTKTFKAKSFGVANAQITILKAATEKCFQEIKDKVKTVENLCKDVLENVKLSNFKLLSVIKMFSEDGNFGLQEVKDIIKNLGKLYTTAEKSINNFIKDIKIKELQFTKTVDTKNYEVTAKIKNLIEEFKLVEETKNKMKILQNNIKKEVCTSKYEFKKLEKRFESFQSLSEKNLGKQQYFSEFCDEFKNILEETRRIESYIQHPEPVEIYSATLNQLKTEKETATKHSTSKIEEKGLEKYTKILFSVKTNREDNNYISNLNKTLEDSWHHITKYAKDFYLKHATFDLEENKIHHTFEKFLEEISQTFKIYQVQYEIEWMREAAVFTTFVNHLKVYLENYLKCFLNEFCNTNLNNYEKLYECQLNQWKTEKNIIESFYKNLHDKLKPMYGHPNNKKLLQNLQKEFENFSRDLEEKIQNFSEPYTTNFSEVFEKSTSDFIDIKNKLNDFKEEILEDIKTDIKNQLEIKVELAKNLIKNKTEPEEECHDIITFIFEYLATVDENIMEKFCPSIETISQFSTSSSCSQKNSETFLEDMEYNLKQYSNHFQDIEVLEFVKKLQKQWNISVEQILQLFAVKYDENSQ